MGQSDPFCWGKARVALERELLTQLAQHLHDAHQAQVKQIANYVIEMGIELT
jgi:hypothetical protein